LANPTSRWVDGDSLAGTYIQENQTWDAYTGQVEEYEDSAAGGLPAEEVRESYDTAGDPVSIGGNWAYVDSLSYTDLGQPLKYTSGSSAEPIWSVDSYGEQTGNLTRQETQTGTTPVTVDDQSYGYDNTGQTQDQCYQYDYLGRLSQAWSQGSSSCASGPSQTAESGAAAGYWDQYTYNDENDMTREVSTPASGAAATTTDAYAPAGSAQPHAVSSQTVTTSSGSTTTKFGYDPDGRLTSESGGSSDSLTWNPAGQPASMTTSAGTTGYIYDADGHLLIQKDPASTTLYLSDEEITLTGSTLSGTRYYQLGGQTVAARTGAGAVYYLTGDQEGTQTLAINSSTLAVTERFYDPYGNSVGTAASGWPGEQGFQDGTTDTPTSLTDLGAREYDSGTASFISPDPLLVPSDPQNLNPYAYAGDSPPSSEDPSGARQTGGGAGTPPNPCGVDAPSSCNPNGGGGVNPGAPSASGGGGSGRAPAGGSDGSADPGGGFVALSPHVVIEKDDPYYQSMVNALDNLLSTDPGYGKLLSDGNINTGDWVWSVACRAAGPNACNPLFMAQITPGGDTTPLNAKIFIGAAFGPAGFAVATPEPSSAGSDEAGTDNTGGMYGPFYRLSSPKTRNLSDLVNESGEFWGTNPTNNLGGPPRVKAYRGALSSRPRAGEGSFEFYTPVEPRPAGNGAPPDEAAWFEGDPGVRSFTIDGTDWAAIPVTVTEVVLGDG
jgi:RHS repeat-associated protein